MRKEKISIIGFPMDLGSGRRGVDMGPSALRIAGLKNMLNNLDYEVEDLGDISIEIMERQNLENLKLRYLNEVLKTSKMLAEIVEDILDKEKFPLCIGGDHSMALGTIAGIAAHCRKNGKTFGVIWIDAHADMNTDLTTPSGNIHGMPLAAAMGLGHKALVDFYGFSPKLLPQSCSLIATRSIDAGEKDNIRLLNPTVYTMSSIDKLGIHRVISKVLKQFKQQVDHIHVSFDVDSVDPLFAPGVGTPVKGGLNFREAHLLMETIAECGCMSSLEVAEVNPVLDIRNSTAIFAAELIASSMGQRIL